MPVKIGNSYVSEAAYNYAAAQANEEANRSDATGKSGLMKSLAEKFPNLKFSIGTGPFSGTGTNNVSISPKILKQMENDPDKRLEYEALIYDISNTDLAQGRNLKGAGFIIGDDGGLRAWSISGGNEKNQASVKRSGERNWWQKLLKKPPKKNAALKEAQERLLEKRREKAEERLAAEKKAAAIVDISDAGKETLALSQKENAKISFADSNELSRYLFQNYAVAKGGMTRISSKYLRDCVKDDEKLQALFNTLSAADAALKEKQGEVGFQGMRVIIDENGEVTTESSKSTITINEEKSRRQIAAAATKGDMQAVMAHLQQDLQAVEDGLKQNKCDEAEVEKAKKLIELAKQQMAKLPDRAPTPEESAAMSVNMLL